MTWTVIIGWSLLALLLAIVGGRAFRRSRCVQRGHLWIVREDSSRCRRCGQVFWAR